MSPIPVHLAVEDDLSECVLRRVLLETDRDYCVGTVFARGGFGYLRSRAKNFNAAAIAGTPIVLLTDLDQYECPQEIIQEWLGTEPHGNLIFRIAVREVESWLLADREGVANFLNINTALLPLNPDDLPDPKRTLVNLARRCRIRRLRESIVPRARSTATQGPDYNNSLCDFVLNQWNCNAAVNQSPSLRRAWDRLMLYEPTWA